MLLGWNSCDRRNCNYTANWEEAHAIDLASNKIYQLQLNLLTPLFIPVRSLREYNVQVPWRQREMLLAVFLNPAPRLSWCEGKIVRQQHFRKQSPDTKQCERAPNAIVWTCHEYTLVSFRI